MTFEDAATLGVGITTVGQGLYQSLGLPLPGADVKANFPILIYGGSSATGTLAIQYARLSGCSKIITTCSPRNFDLVKSLGADIALDYNDPQCAQKIRDYTNDSLEHALDCISTKESAEISSSAIGPKGGVVSYLLSVKHDREDVEVKFTLGYSVTGEAFSYGHAQKWKFAPKPEDFEFGKEFWGLTEKLLADGRVKPHPAEVGEGGLEGVFKGLQAMREGRVSGKKLVYRVDETQ